MAPPQTVPDTEVGEAVQNWMMDHLIVVPRLRLCGKRGYNIQPVRCFFCLGPTQYLIAIGHVAHHFHREEGVVIDSMPIGVEIDSPTAPVLCDDCEAEWERGGIAVVVVHRTGLPEPARTGQIAFVEERVIADLLKDDGDKLDKVLNRGWCYMGKDWFSRVLALNLPSDIEVGDECIITHDHGGVMKTGQLCLVLQPGNSRTKCRTPLNHTIYPQTDYLRRLRRAPEEYRLAVEA